MTLFNIGFNNIKRNFKNYFSYFISILSSVFILIIFYSIYYNKRVQSFSAQKASVGSIFKVASFVVIIFSAIFIWYSNNFFIKNKKKEVAIYSLIGMRKKEIGMLMFSENIFLGVLALLIGTPVGIYTSTFFLKIFTSCIKSVVPIKYNFDIRSVLMTTVVFMIIFLFNSIKAYKIIYQYKLIELLRADKEGENQPEFSKVLAILSLVMLIGGYIIAATMDLSIGGKPMLAKAFLVITLIIAGIYILFNNFIIYGIRLIQKNKNVYYRGQNLVGISQIIYRIKGNSNMLATIAVISSVAMTALCFTFSTNAMLDDIIPSGSAFSVMYEGSDDALNRKVEQVINDGGVNRISYKTDIKMINAKGSTRKYSEPFDSNTGLSFDLYIMSRSDYGKIMNNTYLNKGSDITSRATDINVKSKNDCFFIEVSRLGTGRGRLTGEKLNATIGGKQYDLNISDSDIKCVTGIKFQKTVIVVTDEMYNELFSENSGNLTIIRGYNFNDPLKNESIETKIKSIMPADKRYTSYYDEFLFLHRLYGSFVFIGVFLGILFVFSTGSMMYYKQIMEASEDKERYHTLFKIGFSRKDTSKTVFKQLGFIFGLPLFFGIVNSLVAMYAYVKYVANGGSASAYLIECIAGMMVVYVAVYACYYLLSVRSYMKIIKASDK